MSRLIIIVSMACIAASLFAQDGKALFEEKKCARCHSVDSQNIAYTGKKEAHDLSKTGESGLDKAAMIAYLKKETEHNGKTHKLKFKGEDAELDKLVDWLLTLK